MNYFLNHLASCGLIFDIIGVSILFFIVVSVGEQVIRFDKEEEKQRLRKKIKKEMALKIGYGLIFIGFILQLIAAERNNVVAVNSNNKIVKTITLNSSGNLTNIKGNWYLNKWAPYHTLKFTDSTVFVDNNIDTVFTLNYSINDDTIATWANTTIPKLKNKIILLSADSLVLDGIRDNNVLMKYSRRKE